MKRVTKKVGKYEVGRTIGEGAFAKVKFAKNPETGESVAIKVLDKNTILKHKMMDHIKREISITKIMRHPNIVRLYEVLSSHAKIYIILEFINGGELFDKIVNKGKLSERNARSYFQQLIDAVAYCHGKGVYHRDLKPENLLLDSEGKLKVSDFGLSALPQEGVELLYTTCGTPNYIAPEQNSRPFPRIYLQDYHAYVARGRIRTQGQGRKRVLRNANILIFKKRVLSKNGYDGAAVDIWSCGVILFVLLAGYLPFEESNLASLYEKVNAADFSYPFWFPHNAKSLIDRILDPNPETRIRIDGIREHPWFQVNYRSISHAEDGDVSLDDVQAVFEGIEDQYVTEKSLKESGPLVMNAFEMITLSQGLKLSALFDRHQDHVKRQTRFVSRKPAKDIISAIEAVAELLGFKVQTRGYKTRLEGASVNHVGQFAVVLEVFEVAPSLFMVDVRKAAGDTLEYHKFYKNFCNKLDHIIWKSKARLGNSSLYRTKTY